MKKRSFEKGKLTEHQITVCASALSGFFAACSPLMILRFIFYEKFYFMSIPSIIAFSFVGFISVKYLIREFKRR